MFLLLELFQPLTFIPGNSADYSFTLHHHFRIFITAHLLHQLFVIFLCSLLAFMLFMPITVFHKQKLRFFSHRFFYQQRVVVVRFLEILDHQSGVEKPRLWLVVQVDLVKDLFWSYFLWFVVFKELLEGLFLGICLKEVFNGCGKDLHLSYLLREIIIAPININPP